MKWWPNKNLKTWSEWTSKLHVTLLPLGLAKPRFNHLIWMIFFSYQRPYAWRCIRNLMHYGSMSTWCVHNKLDVIIEHQWSYKGLARTKSFSNTDFPDRFCINILVGWSRGSGTNENVDTHTRLFWTIFGFLYDGTILGFSSKRRPVKSQIQEDGSTGR